MPTLRFNKALETVRGIKLFLNLSAGATRGAVPRDVQREPKNRDLRDANKRIRKQSRMLAEKEREITRLKMRLAAGEHSGRTAGVQGPSESAGDPQNTTLPDFLVIGTQKGGTTSFYRLLTRHPRVRAATTKEVHYFDVHFAKGIDWYASHFPAANDGAGRTLTGEASPYYLYHPHAARRASQALPDVKLIALLRDPVDRAYSDYNHKRREGREPLSFEEAVAAEKDRIAGEREKMLADESYQSVNYRRYSYLSRGIYADQIEEWNRYFARDQMLVIKSEDFFSDPLSTLATSLSFLDLPRWEPPDQDLAGNPDVRHEGSYGTMDPKVRRRLEAHFEPHNRRLYDHLGTDFGW
jgi:hypothetical protein